MRHRLQWFVHLRAHGRERKMCSTPLLVGYGTVEHFTFYSIVLSENLHFAARFQAASHASHNAVYCYERRKFRGLSFRVSGTPVSPAETDEPIEMLFLTGEGADSSPQTALRPPLYTFAPDGTNATHRLCRDRRRRRFSTTVPR